MTGSESSASKYIYQVCMFWLSKHDKVLIKMYRGEQIIQYEKKIEFDKELQY